MNNIEINKICQQFDESAAVFTELKESMARVIADAATMMTEAVKSGNKILFCGNGGSAADSQHLAAELVGRYNLERRGVAAVALTTDTSLLTSIGNDYGFEHIFRRQVEALGNQDDILVGLSTSGSSRNVILALKEAEKKGMKRIVLVGSSAGEMSQNADLVIAVPSENTPRIQEAHAAIGHILCGIIEERLFS